MSLPQYFSLILAGWLLIPVPALSTKGKESPRTAPSRPAGSLLLQSSHAGLHSLQPATQPVSQCNSP